MTNEDFIFFDRCQKIKQINQEYNLENYGYVSFSGGLDSTVLSVLIDCALPNNKIPRVFINTGIEYFDIVNFVENQRLKDNRIVVVRPLKNIKEILNEKGYPFKSKEFSHKMELLKNGSNAESIQTYFELNGKHGTRFSCPKKLLYLRNKELEFKISDKCCTELKKKPAKRWSDANTRPIAILGIRQAEGGQRANVKNCLYFQKKELKHFSPMLVCDDNFIKYMINRFHIEYCKLYDAPYNFRRTGCKGCPFSLDLQKQLDTMATLLPREKSQCEYIFAPVYAEYRSKGYRLQKE